MEAKSFKLVPNEHGRYDFIELPELEEFEAFVEPKEDLPTPELFDFKLKCDCDKEYLFFFGKHETDCRGNE